MDLRLSQELLAYAQSIEQGRLARLSPQERRQTESDRGLASAFAKFVVLSREVIGQESLPQSDAFVQEHRAAVDYWLDELYTLEQLENVFSLVRRTMRLAQLGAHDLPSKQTNRYISESTRAYLQGLQLASIAMSRAALEQALKERLGRQNDGKFWKLGDLIRDAGRPQGRKRPFLSVTGVLAAKCLAKKCNLVLHECPVDGEDDALEVLIGIRSLLEEAYSAADH